MPVSWGAILVLLCFFGLIGILGVIKARKKKQQAYYTVTGVAFIIFLAIGLALFNQFILSFIPIIVVAAFSAIMLPKMLRLYRQEIFKLDKKPMVQHRCYSGKGTAG